MRKFNFNPSSISSLEDIEKLQDSLTKEEIEENRKLMEELEEKYKKRQEEQQETIRKIEEAYENRKRQEAENSVIDRGIVLNSVAEEANSWWDNLKKFFDTKESAKAQKANAELRKHTVKDGKVYREKDYWKYKGHNHLMFNFFTAGIGTPLLRTIDPAFRFDDFYEEVPEEQLSNAITNYAEVRAKGDANTETTLKVNNFIDNLLKVTLHDLPASIESLIQSFNTGGELGKAQRESMWLGLKSEFFDYQDYMAAMAGYGGMAAIPFVSEENKEELALQKSNSDARLLEAYDALSEEEKNKENLRRDKGLFKAGADIYSQRARFKAEASQMAAMLEGREIKGLFDDSNAEPLSEEKIPMYDPLILTEGTENPLIALEKLPEDGESLFDAQVLMRDDNGIPILDDYGNAVYKDKYSKGQKLFEAFSNSGRLFTDKYTSDMLIDGLSSSAGSLASGGIASKGVKILGKTSAKVLTKGIKGLDKVTGNIGSRSTSNFGKRLEGAIEHYKIPIDTKKTGEFLIDKAKYTANMTINSYLLTNTESIVIGNEVFDIVYRDGVLEQLGTDANTITESILDHNPNASLAEVNLQTELVIQNMILDFEKEHPEMANYLLGQASASRKLAISTNNNNLFLNLNIAHYFSSTKTFSRMGRAKSPFSTLGILKGIVNTGIEMGTEFLEEGVGNEFAERSAIAISKGKPLSFSDFLENDLFDTESSEAALLGLVSSPISSGVMNITNTRDQYRLYKEHQEILKSITDVHKLSKEDLKRFFTTSIESVEMMEIQKEISNLIKEGKKDEAEALSEKLFINRATRAALNGLTQEFTEYLTFAATQENLSQEEKDILFESIKLNEKIGDIHDQNVRYAGKNRIIENRLNKLAYEAHLEHLKSTILPELYREKDQALDQQVRKSFMGEKIDPTLDYNILFNQRKRESVLDSKHEIFEKISKAYAELQMVEEFVNILDNEYKHFTSEKGQKEYNRIIKQRKNQILSSRRNNKDPQKTKKEAEETVEGKTVINPEVNVSVDEAAYEDSSNLNTENITSTTVKNPSPVGSTEFKNAFDDDLFANLTFETDGSEETNSESQSQDTPKVGENLQGGVVFGESDSLFAYSKMDPNTERNKTLLDKFEKGIKTLREGSPTLNFDGFIAGARSHFGSHNVEIFFDLFAQAWENQTKEFMSEEERLEHYERNFGNFESAFSGISLTGGASTQAASESVIETETSSTITEETQIDPITNEEVPTYRGYKITLPTLKLAFLGLNYTLEDDGLGFETISDVLNESSYPALHFENFKIGDKVTLKFDFDYMLNPDNNMRIWHNTDSQKPTYDLTTVSKAIEHIYGEGSYGRVASELSADTRREFLLKPENEELLKIMATSFDVRGESTELGLNDYYWWNAMNVAMETDRESGQPLVERQKRLIAIARENNLQTRKQMLANPNMAVEMQVIENRVAFKNYYEKDGKFRSITEAFDNNEDAAKKTLTYGVVKGKTLVSEGSKGKGILKHNGKIVKPEQIDPISLKKFIGKDGKMEDHSGKAFFIQEEGRDRNGESIYSIHHILNNHEDLQDRFHLIHQIGGALYNLGSYVSGKKAAPSHEILDRAKKVAEFFQREYGINIASDKDRNEKFRDFYPKKNPNYVAEGDSERDSQMVQTYELRISNTKASEKIPDIRGYKSVSEFIEAAVKGTVPSTNYHSIMSGHILAMSKFTEITAPGLDPIWTDNIQTVIQFNNSHLNQEAENISETSSSNIQVAKEDLRLLENRESFLKKALERETDEERKKKLEEELVKNEKDIKNQQAKIKLLEAVDETSQELEEEIQETDEAPLKSREPIQEDIVQINKHLIYKTISLIDFSTPFSKSDLVGSPTEENDNPPLLEIAFNDFLNEVKKRGNSQEVAFLLENRNKILGISENGISNYEGSVKEQLDALFSLEAEEDFDFNSENITDYIKESYERDVTNSLSDSVKMLLSGLVDTKTESDNFGGIPEYMPFSQSVDALQQLMDETSVSTLEELKKEAEKKLLLNDVDFGFYTEIVRRLEKLQNENSPLLNQIFYQLYQPKTDMVFIMYSVKENGEYTLQRYDANSKNPDILTRQKWKDNLKISPLVSRYEEGLYKIREEEAEKVYKLYEEIKDGLTSDLIYKDKIREYLSYFGIEVSEETLNAMSGNLLGNPNLSLLTKEIQKDEEGNEYETGGEYGILASNQIIDLLKKNLDHVLREQNIGKLLNRKGLVSNSFVNAAIESNFNDTKDEKTRERLEILSSRFKKLKNNEEKIKLLMEASKEGILKNQGKLLAFENRYVYDKEKQSHYNVLTTDTTGALRNLIVANNLTTFIPRSGQRIAGKSIYAFQQPKRISNILKKLKKDPAFLQQIKDAQISSRSLTVELLENYPELKSFMDVVNMSLESLKEFGSQSRNDMGINQLSDKDAFVTLFNLFAHSDGAIYVDEDLGIAFRKGAIAFPTLSDSSQLPVFKTALIDLQVSNFDVSSNFTRLNESVLEFTFDKMVRGDLERIAAYERSVELQKAGEKLASGRELTQRETDLIAPFLKVKEDEEISPEKLIEIGRELNQKINIKGFNSGSGIITSMVSLHTLLVDIKDKDGNTFKVPLSEAFKKFGPTPGKLYREDIDGFYQTYKKEILNEIQRVINAEVSYYIDESGTKGALIEDEIFKDGSLHYMDQMYLDSKGDNSSLTKARIAAYDYVLNNMIQLREIQHIFSGDVAGFFKEIDFSTWEFGMPPVDAEDIIDYYYSHLTPEEKEEVLKNRKDAEYLDSISEIMPEALSAKTIAQNHFQDRIKHIAPVAGKKLEQILKSVQNNLSKRLKAPISPGNQFPYYLGNRKYYQIMVSDVDSSSEVLESIIKYQYPDATPESLEKVRRFKVLDDIYESNRTDEQAVEHRELLKEFQKKLFPKIAGFFETASTDAQEYTTWRDNVDQLFSQGRITFEEHKKIVEKFEKQVDDLEKHGRIQDENRWQEDEQDLKEKAMFQPSKPLYSGVHYDNVNGYVMSRDIYIKSSSFPLYPELTEMFPKLNSLRKNMEKIEKEYDGVVRLSYDSANKVGSVLNPMPINELYDENYDISKIHSSMVELDRDNFFIQQDKPYDPDKIDRTRATQFEKILLGDGLNKIPDRIFPNVFDKNILKDFGINPNEKNLTGPELKTIYDRLYEREQKILVRKAFERLGIKNYTDISQGNVRSMRKLARILRGGLENKQDLKFLELTYIVDINGTKVAMDEKTLKEGNHKPLSARFKIPMYMMPNSRKFESVLNSFVNKNNINLTLTGFSSPVGSQEGFDFKGYDEISLSDLKESGLITTKNFDIEKGLQATYNRDGSLKTAQVFTTNKLKYFNAETGAIETVVLTDYLDENGQLNLPPEILEIFSYRIPTSSHQSGVKIEIVGFLPENSADLMIVPKDHTVQIGEDYDIDVRYAYSRLLYKTPEGKLEVLGEEYLKQLKEEAKDFSREKYEESTKELFERTYTLLSDREGRFFVQNYTDEITELLLIKSAIEDYEARKVVSYLYNSLEERSRILTKEELEVLYQELYSELIPESLEEAKQRSLAKTLKEVELNIKKDFGKNYHSYLKSMEYDRLSSYVIQNNIISLYLSVFGSPDGRVQNLIGKALTTDSAKTTAEMMEKKLERDDKPFNIFSPSLQRDVLKAGAFGKIGIGEHSNAVTMNSIFQQSDHEHRLVQFYDEEMNPIFYNIKLGKLVFDGIMGKVEKDGLRTSELGMESQNVSADNQKLEIMKKRNENPSTMTVLKILQANLIDKDNISINGEVLSYSSLFINQPILRDFSTLSERLQSRTASKTYNEEDQLENKLLRKYGEGLMPYWKLDILGEPIIGELSEAAKEKAGGMLTSDVLWENLEERTSQNLLQWYVYETFKTLQGAARKYNDLQKFINIEQKGLGISFFDTIKLMEDLEYFATNTSSPEITNQSLMIGNHRYLDFSDPEYETESEKLIKEGYIRVRDKATQTLFIKPSNHYSHKIVNSITLGYNTFKSLFPFDNPVIGTIISEAISSTKIKEDSKEELEFKYDIMSNLKDYTYANNRALFGENFDEKVREIFFDVDSKGPDSNMSLPRYILENKNLLKGPFFDNLEFSINSSTHPSTMKFNNVDRSKLNDNDLFNSFVRLMNSETPLPKFNGREYSGKELMKDLLIYSLISDQDNGATGFRHILPPALLEEHGVNTSLNNVSPEFVASQNKVFNGLYKSVETTLGSTVSPDGIIYNRSGSTIEELRHYIAGVNRAIESLSGVKDALKITSRGNVAVTTYTGDNYNSVFIKQFFQHNPSRTRNVGGFRRQEDEAGFKRIVPDYKLKSILTANNFKGNIKELTYFTLPGESDFIHIKDETGQIMLFEKKAKDYYERITILGTSGFNEYRPGREVTESKILKNKIPDFTEGYRVPVVYNLPEGSGNVEVNLKNIFENFAKDYNGPYRALWETMRAFVDFENTKTQIGPLGGRRGKYDPKTNTITLGREFMEGNPSSEELQRVFAEELLHSITTQAASRYVDIKAINPDGTINYSPKKDENGDDIVIPAPLINLLLVYEKALKHYSNKIGSIGELMSRLRDIRSSEGLASTQQEFEENQELYNLTDFHEFLAGVFFKDEAFAKEMANTPYMSSGKSILQKFAETLGKFFNRLLPNRRTDTMAAEVVTQLYSFLRENGNRGIAPEEIGNLPNSPKKRPTSGLNKGIKALDEASGNQIDESQEIQQNSINNDFDVLLPIGTSGSGKSTFIKSLPQENLVVIEPDAMRVEFTGDMNDKSKDKEIYEEAAKRAIAAIKQGKQVVFDTTNLTKEKRLPFIEAIKKEIPTANIQYKLMELNPELAKQRIKAQLERGENRANVPDSTIDRHAKFYKQMLEDIKSEPISNYEVTPEQKQQAQQLYSQYLEQNPNGSVEQFKNWLDNNQSDIQYQLPQGREIEEFVASEKTIRDLAARMSDRIGVPVRFESDRTKKYKGKLENGTAVVNLAYATLDTPIHEILGHPIIRAIKGRYSSQNKYITSEIEITQKLLNKEITREEAKKLREQRDNPPTSQLYQNLLKELEYGKGKEVFDRVKRDYVYKEGKSRSYIVTQADHDAGKFLDSEVGSEIGIAELYTLEEQQEEALVELLGLYTVGRLDKVKDGKLISLLKRLLKEMKAFMRSLIGQKEIEIDKLPDNMTLGDIADLLAYSNSKLILPGNEVVYTTPDNRQFKTYAEASKHISELIKSVEDVDLNDIKIITYEDYLKDNKVIDGLELQHGKFLIKKNIFGKERVYFKSFEFKGKPFIVTEEFIKNWLEKNNYLKQDLRDFIEKNKEYEQSKEIIEEWKKVNNIQYNPEEVYSRGQEFVSVVGAYSDFDVNLMMQNLLQHIEDNQKAGGEFTISAFTKPVDRKIRHLEGGGGKIRFKIYPQSQDIKWAANTDVYSGSVWDASEKVSKDKKSELLGVSYTKYPSLHNVNTVQPNLAAIIDNLAYHHNELGISLTGSNFRLEYDENIPYSTKKIIDSINSILDQKHSKLVIPKVENNKTLSEYEAFKNIENKLPNFFDTGYTKYKKENGKWYKLTSIDEFNKKSFSEIELTENSYYNLTNLLKAAEEHLGIIPPKYKNETIQPTQTNETLKESIESVSERIGKDIYYIQLNSHLGKYVIYGSMGVRAFDENFNSEKEAQDFLDKKYPKKEYTEQALTNLKIAKLKEVVKKYPRSLIRSEVRPITSSQNDYGFTETELPFQKVSDNSFQQVQQNNRQQQVSELFESDPKLANSVYEAVGFKIKDNNLNKISFGEIDSTSTHDYYTIQFEGKTIGKVDLNHYGYIDGIEIEAKYRNKGLGKSIYRKINSELLQGNLKSDSLGRISEDAKRVWESLVKSGEAIKTSDGYSFTQSQITPQQKQQAQQLYAQYLEQNPNGNVEGFKNWVDNNQSNSQITNDQKTFDEIEKVSNMIMNKILTKEGRFYKKDGKKAKEDFFYNSEKQIRIETEREVITNVFKYFNSLETINKLSDSELLQYLKDKMQELEKVKNEVYEKRNNELEELYSIRRIIQSFSKVNSKEELSKYSEEQQNIIKEYYSKLFKDNNYKTEKQALFHQSQLALKKINKKINFHLDNKSFLGINSIIKKLKVTSDFIEIVPNWRQLLEDKVENEYQRRLEYKTKNLKNNPELQKTISFRKLWQQSSHFSQEMSFEKRFKFLTAHKKRIKSVFKDYDSSKEIMSSTNTVEILTTIANGSSEYKDLARSLINFAEKNNVEIVVLNTMDKGTVGRYSAKVGQIENSKGEQVASFVKNQIITLDGTSERFAVNPEQLVLHEIVHSLSSIAIASESHRKGGKSIFDGYLKYLITKSTEIRDTSDVFLELSMPYGFTNSQELFSEALTNPEFRELLKMIPPTASKNYTNFLEEFLDKVAKFISKLFKKDSNYENSLEQLEDLMYNTFEVQSNMPLNLESVLESLEGDIKNYKVTTSKQEKENQMKNIPTFVDMRKQC